MKELTEQLMSFLQGRVKEQEPMSRHTNFRIGGPARWFVEVRSVEELIQVIRLAKLYTVHIYVFGGGSNLLVRDQGFDGIMIQIAMREIQIDGTRVKAQAGALSTALARATAQAGLNGFTWAISLPGTIGGAVRGNAGCFGGEAKDHLLEVEVLRDEQIITISKKALVFGYRESSLKHSDDIILRATFEFELADPILLVHELEQTLALRKTSQPSYAGSAGCLFKNYDIQSDEELQRLQRQLDIPDEMSQHRRLSAGWLIDQLDLKGRQIGDAKISEKHGNFVINTAQATADQVMQLMALIKTRARNEFGIQLIEEVQII